MADLSKIRNIGISAHIDSGKTTLSERILYYTGKIHAIHEVRGKDGVGAKMDSMDLEREKGITIQSAATYCTWGDYDINLIDTPGHVDFTVEVERALRVLDGAVLVLCSVAGVQSQSITVDRQMRRYNVPRLAFINKCDRSGANPDRVADQLREKLAHNPAFVTYPIGLEDRLEGVIDIIAMKAIYFDGEGGSNIRKEEIPADLMDKAKDLRHRLIEVAADFDDALMEKFLLDEQPTPAELTEAVRKGTLSMKMTPVFCGSAYKNKGVQTLLDGVTALLPAPADVKNEALDQDNNEARVTLQTNPDKDLVMLAFKLEDGRYGQLTYMRIYQGTIKKGDSIINIANGKKVKVPRLVRMHSDDMNEIDQASAGDIVAMFGVDCASGDTFTDGNVRYTMTSMFVPDPVIELAVAPKDKAGLVNFSKALNRFTKEDPTFRVMRDEESGETIIKGMGELHLEIYIERIKREYNTEVTVGRPKVAFRETLTQLAEFNYTHKKQTGGSGQFARVGGFIEPLPGDAVENYEFVDDIVGGVIPREYIPACDKGFKESILEGSLIGQPVVRVRVTINDGASHAVDSSEMAFKTAAIMAFREAYSAAKPTILEPIMKLEVSVPDEFQGSVIGQLNQRRGVIMGTDSDAGYVTVECEVPLSEMFGYSTDLRSATQGKGEFSMEFKKYQPVPRNIQEEMIKEHQKKRAEGK
ncbi:MAG: elongation factor G [Ignavibacteria bacterium]|nr:elongation factor G [Ignavibacteria bacterium]MBP6509022.1 elongation factor G [Candidatus Kapabacteria bacterium]MBK6419413.1 elongation factor G [Ignavibacteria bacterium]MBK6759957.1 elongation factor G [Ignavibacteria bacterium]MBK7184846.1 elongation factor G [Ignavibacteria bacterium]